MQRFRIYYADGATVEGATAADWRAAPDTGVQVVVAWPREGPVRWSCRSGAVRDRDLWTGVDEYDPWGWGAKRGSLIGSGEYFSIWEAACGDVIP